MADEQLDDFTFTFDTEPFEKGLKKIGDGLGRLKDNTAKIAKSMSSSMAKGIQRVAVKALALVGAFKGIRSAIREMPEIGQAFSMVKDIIFRNLFYPLRQTIFPLLQKFLDWTRDNRAMFIRWGQTLANVFRSVVSGIKKIIEVGKTLLSSFSGFLAEVFGKPMNNLQDLMNLLSFKFATVVTFITQLITPLVKAFEPFVGPILVAFGSIAKHIGEIVGSLFTANGEGRSFFTVLENVASLLANVVNFLVQITESFVKGLAPHIKEIMGPISRIAESFKSIFESIFGSNEAISGWKEVFEFIGNAVGTTILGAFQGIADIVVIIDRAIKNIKTTIDFLSGKELTVEQKEDFLKGAFDAVKFFNPALGLKTMDDGIVKSDGTVIKTHPNDTLIATKNPIIGPIAPKTGISKEINLSFPGFQIILQEGTKEQAEEFSVDVVNMIRQTLNSEIERTGGQ